jgi:hypothetical protein
LSLTGGLNPLLSSIMRRFVETRRATSPPRTCPLKICLGGGIKKCITTINRTM